MSHFVVPEKNLALALTVSGAGAYAAVRRC